MWFTLGLIHGESARVRGSPIPNLINDLINRLGDAIVSVAMVDRVRPTLLTQEAWIIYPFLFYLFLIHSNIIS